VVWRLLRQAAGVEREEHTPSVKSRAMKYLRATRFPGNFPHFYLIFTVRAMLKTNLLPPLRAV
jgi:hypothetical protein